MLAKLVLIRGIPGSGKTTLAEKLVEKFGYKHVEADMYRSRSGTYKFDPSENEDAHAWCLETCAEYLEAGCSVVVANTFTKLWELQKYLDFCPQHTTVIECTGAYENIHEVPDIVVESMAENFESYPNKIYDYQARSIIDHL